MEPEGSFKGEEGGRKGRTREMGAWEGCSQHRKCNNNCWGGKMLVLSSQSVLAVWRKFYWSTPWTFPLLLSIHSILRTEVCLVWWANWGKKGKRNIRLSCTLSPPGVSCSSRDAPPTTWPGPESRGGSLSHAGHAKTRGLLYLLSFHYQSQRWYAFYPNLVNTLCFIWQFVQNSGEYYLMTNSPLHQKKTNNIHLNGLS